MSESNADVVAGIYAAFGAGDIPGILATIDENIAWRVPENLPHGGDFAGRDGVGQFFQGLGAAWDDIGVELDGVVSEDERVIVLARLQGNLRATGERTGYSSAHCWTLRDGVPVRFDEYVDAPLSLPSATG